MTGPSINYDLTNSFFQVDNAFQNRQNNEILGKASNFYDLNIVQPTFHHIPVRAFSKQVEDHGEYL